ncbi:hypothetical protein COCSUDRAFT_59964 [Coccomyxa subellipsoidea C-169]|uniref:Uncharacterized protein n=1 Tax=Coccomyxa subellipsoidea (strain C-169) TaxID=574566 RepID=I0YJT6_COCSC|nr:hypothetical protein COCSUDRAFT_59964 [Coccomyxa subellipsoidea C-169]EIE18655.1 hypothetical protein COCSUDRAFT_59964 [Coccomyxa subellipsoidea C-169]|eukprot:XP_005643199.1 hypothetical protein COCSUDRAFT_59964 [Coccomyxa subellipsoidea C-169]
MARMDDGEAVRILSQYIKGCYPPGALLEDGWKVTAYYYNQKPTGPDQLQNGKTAWCTMHLKAKPPKTFQPSDGRGRKDCYYSFKAVAVAMGLLPSNSLIKELTEPARVKAYKQLTGNKDIGDAGAGQEGTRQSQRTKRHPESYKDYPSTVADSEEIHTAKRQSQGATAADASHAAAEVESPAAVACIIPQPSKHAGLSARDPRRAVLTAPETSEPAGNNHKSSSSSQLAQPCEAAAQRPASAWLADLPQIRRRNDHSDRDWQTEQLKPRRHPSDHADKQRQTEQLNPSRHESFNADKERQIEQLKRSEHQRSSKDKDRQIEQLKRKCWDLRVGLAVRDEEMIAALRNVNRLVSENGALKAALSDLQS